MAGLETQTAPGAEAQVSEEMKLWLREIVLETTPEAYGYDTRLWSRDILAEMLYYQFGVRVCGRTISWHLRKMGLSYQKPQYLIDKLDLGLFDLAYIDAAQHFTTPILPP